MACKPCTNMNYTGTKTCPSCRGDGKDRSDANVFKRSCPNCGGTGQVCKICGAKNS